MTCARHFEEETEREILSILSDIGDASPQVDISKYPGILTVKTKVPHTEITQYISEKLEEEPWKIRYIFRLIPVLETVDCNAESIAKSAESQAKRMKAADTYRITIEKRDSDLKTSEIISQIAERVENKVSLEKYDWIILVETIGDLCGVSLLRDEDILSIQKKKRVSSE